MPEAMPARKVLDREFLEIRAKILELAASFDRLERGGGGLDADPRMERIRQALAALGSGGESRAEAVQMIFSRSFDENWRAAMNV